MNLLEKVKELCAEKCISQRKLEIELELSNGATSKWGKSSPSADVLQKVADFFDVSMDYLLGKVPFKNESEAYYSISIASVKFLLNNKEEIPYGYDIDSGMEYMFDNEFNEDMRAYCYSLLHKFDNKLYLTDLELFELSNIIFSEIKWTKDFDGIVYLKNFNDDIMTIRLDFNNINKINKNKLNLDNSFLLKSKNFNDDSFLKYDSIFNTIDTTNLQGKERKDDRPTKTTHLPEEELTNEKEKNKLMSNLDPYAPATDVKQAMDIIMSQPGLMLNGEMLSDESKIALANAIQMGLAYAEQMNKKDNK